MKIIPAFILIFVLGLIVGTSATRIVDDATHARQAEILRQLSLENLELRARKDCDE